MSKNNLDEEIKKTMEQLAMKLYSIIVNENTQIPKMTIRFKVPIVGDDGNGHADTYELSFKKSSELIR